MIEQISAGIENISDGQEHKALNTTHVIENNKKLSPAEVVQCITTEVCGCSCTTTCKNIYNDHST